MQKKLQKKEHEQFFDELSEWAKNKQAKKNSAAFFMAHKEKIAAALAAGYPMKTIWGLLHERKEIPYTYATFRRHVAQFINKTPLDAKEESEQPEPKQSPPASQQKTKSKQFIFNPVPNKEDLI